MGGESSSKAQPTLAQIEAKAVATEQWNWHVAKGKPFEDQFITRAAMPTAAREEIASRTVGADIAQSKQAAEAKVNPNRGTALDVGTKAAEVAGSAIPVAKQAQDDYRTSLVRGYTEMVRGEVPHINANYVNQANNAANNAMVDAAIDQNRTATFNNAVASGAGALVGLGAAASQAIPTRTYDSSFLNSVKPSPVNMPTVQPAVVTSTMPTAFQVR